MDTERFDWLARFVAIAGSRRQLLRALAVSAVGGVVFSVRTTGAAAQETGATGPRTCAQDSDCADNDGDACTGGRCENGTCTFLIVDCVPGYVCCGNGECCPESTDGGSPADQGDAGGVAVVDGSGDGAAAESPTTEAGPVQLPSTGSGRAEPVGDKWRLAPLALLGTGTALVTNWRRRPTDSAEGGGRC